MDNKTITLKLNIIKKGRVWFQCKNSNGYDCKLKINDLSKDLKIGEQEITVKDISVRSDYGTDLRFERVEGLENGVIFLTHYRYNSQLVLKCKNFGGKWDKENKTWVFPKYLENEIEELEYIFNSDIVNVEITAIRDVETQGTIDFCGYSLCKATGRDSGANLCDDICMIKGKIGSAGSMKNWYTKIYEGSVFKLSLPVNVLEKYRNHEEKYFKIEIL
jgi:hypothetical protein